MEQEIIKVLKEIHATIGVGFIIVIIMMTMLAIATYK